MVTSFIWHRLAPAGTAWESRVSKIPSGFRARFIAIDEPLLPQGADNLIRRSCEAIFVRAPFHNRCKPGLSHWGFGLELRRASAEACLRFGGLLDPAFESRRYVNYRGPIVEAFPNAFLGVLTLEAELLTAPKLKRGRRFDWLYEQIATTGRLESILAARLALRAGRKKPRAVGGSHLPSDCRVLLRKGWPRQG
jgi:hypothetical protein